MNRRRATWLLVLGASALAAPLHLFGRAAGPRARSIDFLDAIPAPFLMRADQLIK